MTRTYTRHMASRWYRSDLHVVTTDIENFAPTMAPRRRRSVCSQVTACFTSASTANRLTATFFVNWPKRWKTLGHWVAHCQTALLAGHDATTARLRTTQPTAPTLRPVTSISLNPWRISWLPCDLQQTPTWSKLSLPGYRETPISLCRDTRLGAGVEQIVMSMVTTWRSDMYYPLLKCHVFAMLFLKLLCTRCSTHTSSKRSCKNFIPFCHDALSFTLQSIKSILFESNNWSVYTTSLSVEEFRIIKTKQDMWSLSTDVSRNRHLMEEREHPSSTNEGLSNHKATGWWH